MCSKDQLMNIPFLLQFCQKQLPGSVPHVWAVCQKAVWTESVQPWTTFLILLDRTCTWTSLGPSDPSLRSEMIPASLLLPHTYSFLYVTASGWSLPCSTPQTRTQGPLKSSSSSIFTPPPRRVRCNFSPLYPQPLSSLSLWSSSSGPLQLPLPDLSSLPASLPPLIWSCFSLLKSPSLFTHTYNDKLTFFLTARVLFHDLAVPLSSLTLAAASKLPQSWHSFQTRASSWNIPHSFILSCLPTGYSLCPESPVSSLAIWKLCFTFKDPDEASVPQKAYPGELRAYSYISTSFGMKLSPDMLQIQQLTCCFNLLFVFLFDRNLHSLVKPWKAGAISHSSRS